MLGEDEVNLTEEGRESPQDVLSGWARNANDPSGRLSPSHRCLYLNDRYRGFLIV
jgi:hypothetical protein